MIGIDEKHSIQKRNGKRVIVCNGHFCDLDSISEYEYYKRNRQNPTSDSKVNIIQILELKKNTGMYLGIVLVFMAALMMLPLAFAQPVLISIVQSDACTKSASCLKQSDLISLDTTDQKISGKLSDSGRAKPAYKLHYQMYKFSPEKYIVCVNCDSEFQNHSRIITIESPKSFLYLKQSDNRIINNTFYDYSNRHIEKCRTATVSSDIGLIKDTIYVIGNDCKVPSKFTEQ